MGKKTRYSPNKKMITISPSDFLTGRLLLRIDPDVPLILEKHRENFGLVINIKKET